MGFKKGKPKTGGRLPGTCNKLTVDMRERINRLLDDNLEQVEADLKQLDPKERVNAWLRLLEFALPKLQRSQIELPETPETEQPRRPTIDISFRSFHDDPKQNK